MTLFIRRLLWASLLSLLSIAKTSAQNCFVSPVSFPDTICLGQSIAGQNTGPQTLSYTYDFCAGDLFNTPTNTPMPALGAGGAILGAKLVQDQAGKYVAYFVGLVSNNLFRIEFDTNILAATPVIVNLGNPSSILNGPAGFELVRSGTNWFGFCVNRNNNSVVRFSFTNGLYSPPTVNTISVPGLGTSNSIRLIRDGNNWLGFAPSASGRKLYLLNFGSSLENSPTISSNIDLPNLSCTGVTLEEDCFGKYALLAENTNGRLIKLSFGNSWLNTNPSLENTGLNPPFAGGALSLNSFTIGDRKTAIVGGTNPGGLALANYGSSYQNANPQISTLLSGTVQNITYLSDAIALRDGRTVVFFTTSGGTGGRLVFPNSNCSGSGIVQQYQPPVQTPASAGNYVYSIRIGFPDGSSTTVGKQIVVRNTPFSGPVPSVDFIADEQCTSRQTRFFPQVQPVGTYQFLWTFPSATSTQPNPSQNFPTAGTYPVSLRVRPQNGCGVVSTSRLVKIFGSFNNAIVADFAVPSSICTGDSISFNGTATPASQAVRWKWDFGNGQVYFTQNTKALFNIAQANQTIQVSLKAADSSGCANPTTKPVIPKAGADIQITSSQVCAGQTTQFQNNTPGAAQTNFLWNFGDPASGAANTSTSNQPVVTHLFSDTGLYQVAIRAITTNGCTSNISLPQRIYPLPTVDFNFPVVALPGQVVAFTNASTAPYQTIASFNWNFGNPASGAANNSTLANPTHIYASQGAYQVQLSVNTDRGCSGNRTRQVSIYPTCPAVTFTKSPSASGDFDTLTVSNTTELVEKRTIDFCAGDLELTPVLQSQQTGTPAIANAGQVVPVKDGANWIGFIPAPVASNATCFFKSGFGNSLNNDISNFSTSLGTLQGRFPTPAFIRFFKEDTIWYGIASNGDSRLWRIRFGASLDNNSPTVTEIPLPQGTLATAANAQIVRFKDTTYVFVVNNNNQTNNNVVRLRFRRSLADTPQVFVLNNPLVLQNSNGFTGISFALSCSRWYGFLLAASQLYRLDYGSSLNNTPTAVALTAEVTAGLSSANAFNALRGISMMQDMGKWYGLINANNGNVFRIRFGNGLDQPIDQVSNLGTFGITGTVGALNFIQDGSEVFGLGINNLGTVFKWKFPNRCPASTPYAASEGALTATSTYSAAGKYYLSIGGETGFGSFSQRADSVVLAANLLEKKCFTTAINHPAELCFNYKLNPSVETSGLSNLSWDFCTGDFKLPPTLLAQPLSSTITSSAAIRLVESNGTYFAFVGSPAGLFRYNLGTNPGGVPGQPISVTLPNGGTAFSSLHDFRFFRENNQWFALCVFLNGESMVRLNFGADLTNTNPNFTIINLAGFLSRARGIDLFFERGNRMAMVANQNNGALTLLNFGNSYRNIPVALSIDVPSAINLYKVSMVRECNIWHAFVSDQAQDSLFHLTFSRGLESPPTRKMLPILFNGGVQAVKDGDRYFVFATKVQTNRNNIYRWSFGNSLFNTPRLDSLSNFAVTTPATGLTNVIGFDIARDSKSDNYFFGIGFGNGSIYRLKFDNPCSASKPTAVGDTVYQQSYGSDGKYFFSVEGFDQGWNYVSGLDSVIVKNQVEANFSVPGIRCKGEPVQFVDASVPGTFTNIISWRWDFGDTTQLGDTSTLQNPSFTYTKPGVYAVRLLVAEQFGCTNELITNVLVADKPRPNFTFGSGQSSLLCTNDSIPFFDASTGGGVPIVARFWEVRNNGNLIFTSNRVNPRFLFTQTGSYEVSLRIRGESQCDSTVTKVVNIGGQGALVSFSNPSPCLGELIPFSPQISGAGIDSIAWFVDAAKIAVQPTPANFAYTFTSTNVFVVRLVAYTGGCANSISKILKVNSRPIFSMGTQSALNCQGLPINFVTNINTTETVGFRWNFGDGSSDTVRNPVKTFQQAGTYTVRLRVFTENGCDSRDSLQFVARRAPTAFFTFDKACKDEPVTFTNLSSDNGIPGGIVSYFWEFGNINGQTSTQKDPAPVFYNEAPGSKTVRLTVRTAEDCPNTFSRTFIIGNKLAANFRYESGCIGTPFRFFDNSDAGIDTVVQWNWSIGGLNFTSRNPVVEFDQLGTYDVRLRVVSRSGCTDQVIRTNEFTVLGPAVADFSISAGNFSEPPFRVVFQQVPGINPSYDYLWDFGDSTFSTSPNPPPHLYSKEGTYLVTLSAVRAGTICSTLVQKVVNVIVNPTQGLKINNVRVGKSASQLSLAAEVQNQSNIAIRNMDLIAKYGNLLTIKETWSGILMPGATLTYSFRSDLLSRQSQTVPYICVTAQLTDPSKESSPDDNTACISVSETPSIVSVYPNPAKDVLNVELNLPNIDPVEVRLFNSVGKEVDFLRIENPSVGALQRTLNVAHYRQGMYYLWFRSGSTLEHRKVLIER